MKNLLSSLFLALSFMALPFSAQAQSVLQVQEGQNEISLSASPESLNAIREQAAEQRNQYEEELRSCDKFEEYSDERALCKKEAVSAYRMKSEKQDMGATSNLVLERNAIARCDKLKGHDKASCQARVLGYGSVSGSVEGGGIIKEINTEYLNGRKTITVLPLKK